MYQNAECIPRPDTLSRVFPIKGTNLDKILSDQQYRLSFHGQIKRYNPLVVGLYRAGLLPLFGVSRTVMLRTTPIGYFRIGGALYLFSVWWKGTSWYKNMLANPKLGYSAFTFPGQQRSL